MIPNLKSKLADLPKTKISNEIRTNYKFDTTISSYVKTFPINSRKHDYDLQLFANIDTEHLKKVCKIKSDEIIKNEDIIFFDTETTGLSGGTGTVAFLIGVGRLVKDEFIVKQYLMNDYDQETDLIKEFSDILSGAKGIVTYNGKSYDAPLVKTRAIINSIELKFEGITHFDLLHACRRIYSNRLERCKLIDIESNILDINRRDDVPGHKIPEIFFDYLSSNDHSMLDKVIEHNLYDILAMVNIAGILADYIKNPYENHNYKDKYGIAKLLLNIGEKEEAENIFESIKELYKPAKEKYANILKNKKDYIKAIKEFEELSDISRFDIRYDIEIAKIAEHFLKDFRLAEKHMDIAIEKFENKVFNDHGGCEYEDLIKRKQRIAKKMEKSK